MLQVDDHRDRGRDNLWKTVPRLYQFEHDTFATEVMGLRLYKTSPSVRVIATEDNEVQILVRVFEL